MTSKALIFDFDGTILDTEYPDYASWNDIYRAHGLTLSREVWGGFIGTSLGSFDPLRELERALGRSVGDIESLRAQRRRRYVERVHEQPILPGVADLIQSAKRAGWKLAVASSSTRDWVEGHLVRLGLRDAFETICSGDEVERVKPDPALYLLALERLGITPSQAVAVEDSPNGSKAAIAAGVPVIVIPNRMTESLSFDPQISARLTSLDGVTLENILELTRPAP